MANTKKRCFYCKEEREEQDLRGGYDVVETVDRDRVIIKGRMFMPSETNFVYRYFCADTTCSVQFTDKKLRINGPEFMDREYSDEQYCK